MANSLFGQYVYKDSIAHKIDPRIKLLIVIFISLILFILNSYSSFILISLFVVILVVISHMEPIRILKALRPFLFFFLLILLMYILFSEGQTGHGVMVVWRFVLLVIIASILTFSTSVSQMVYAVEKLFKPLKLFGPVSFIK